MTLRSARVVPAVPALEVAAPSRVVATHHLRTRLIRVHEVAVEVVIGDAVAGEKAEGVGVGARTPPRLLLPPPVDRRTVAGLHLRLGVRDEAIRGGQGLFRVLALVIGAPAESQEIEERGALDPGRDPLSEIRSGGEIGVGVRAGVSVAADRLLDAVESGVDRIPRRGVRVDRALQRIDDATRSVIGAGLVLLLLRREGTVGALGATAVAVKVGVRSGVEGAPEAGPILALVVLDLDLALRLGDVVAPEAEKGDTQ